MALPFIKQKALSAFNPIVTSETVRLPHQYSISNKADNSEHFHWKIDLPRVNFSYIHAAMKGDTLTVQSKLFDASRR